MTPKVSVWMITYNHEKYIRAAIDSVLMQKTNFSFELVIGEDLSRDSTRAICQEYEKNYPDIVRVLAHPTNIGIHENLIVTLDKCRGDYVALLEGDDYWTDDHKLQKQFDFLESNSDYVMCYQKTKEVNELLQQQKITNETDNEVTDLNELLLRGWFIRTGSIMFRNKLFNQFPKWYYDFKSTDYMLQVLVAQYGKIGFLNEVTSVYRRHEGGVTQAFQKQIVVFNNKKIELLNILDDYFQLKYHKAIVSQKQDLNLMSMNVTLRNLEGISDFFKAISFLPLVNYRKWFASWFGFVRRRALKK